MSTLIASPERTARAIITFKSISAEWQRYACAVPGEQTEWFVSPDARDLYARVRAESLGLEVRAGR